MGCDIHATIEYDPWALKMKEKELKHDQDFYGFAKDVDIERAYWLFGLLAGVRDDRINKIDDPRGMPTAPPPSFEYKEECEEWDLDGHSHSWVLFSELATWKHTEGEYNFDPEEGLRDENFYKVMAMLAERYGEENVRLCFFFDN